MYKKREHIHFIGIGGIGMSGIARILAAQGYKISGCDTSISPEHATELRSLGCTIYHEHNIIHLCREAHHGHDEAPQVIVYSSAIKKDHPELLQAQVLGIPQIPRALMLAELMRTKFSVAVTGAHGKTTTTSLISHILVEAGKNPTMIIGGILNNTSTNATLGASDLLVAEADESDRSLLYLNPTMAVITNIDAEHLDTYKDIEDIKATFKNFLERLPFYGKAFVWADDPHIQALLPLPHISLSTFGLSDKAHIQAREIILGASCSQFTLIQNKPYQKNPFSLGPINLALPGVHNILNALAAIALCLEFEVPLEIIAHALNSFKGVKRRFEPKGSLAGAEIYDDYGHHPTEIYHTLLTAQRKKIGKLHVIFQPHRYSRTEKLWQEFINVFKQNTSDYKINYLYVIDIYAASEKPLETITSKRFVQELSQQVEYPVFYAGSYDEAERLARIYIQKSDLVLTIGAGKVYTVAERLSENKLAT